VKVRFQADANLDPDIGLGLQRRDPSLDYRLALGVIPDGMLDPDVLGWQPMTVTNDLRMPRRMPRSGAAKPEDVVTDAFIFWTALCRNS
jgi:hypothetical protein